MRIEDDGIHLHQSDIETFMQCPEKKRLSIIAGINEESFTSDAAFVGTCLHAVIQHELVEGPMDDLFSAHQLGAWKYLQGFEEMVEKGGVTYSRETFGDDARALAALERLVDVWWHSPEREMLMHMDPADYHVEWSFDRLFTTSESGMPIWLAGQADLVLPWAVWDWKSASSPYQRWEKQRWGVQPPVYLWAAQDAGLISKNREGFYEFQFKVAVRKAKLEPFQTVPILKSDAAFEWLRHEAENIANYVEAVGFEKPWLLNDHSALCGPKWCPFWDGCKGKFIDADNDWR